MAKKSSNNLGTYLGIAALAAVAFFALKKPATVKPVAVLNQNQKLAYLESLKIPRNILQKLTQTDINDLYSHYTTEPDMSGRIEFMSELYNYNF
jgi:hypothetical protein